MSLLGSGVMQILVNRKMPCSNDCDSEPGGTEQFRRPEHVLDEEAFCNAPWGEVQKYVVLAVSLQSSAMICRRPLAARNLSSGFKEVVDQGRNEFK